MSLVDEKPASDITLETDVNLVSETKPEQLIYCGPNLPRGILSQFTVFRGGLPKHLEAHFEQCPALKHLFVPVEDLNKTLQAIQKPGTAENVWFKQVLDQFKGGAK
jgi:hypothetical protein